MCCHIYIVEVKDVSIGSTYKMFIEIGRSTVYGFLNKLIVFSYCSAVVASVDAGLLVFYFLLALHIRDCATKTTNHMLSAPYSRLAKMEAKEYVRWILHR